MIRRGLCGLFLLYIAACAAPDRNSYGGEYLSGVVDGVALGISYDSLKKARPKVFANTDEIVEMGYQEGDEEVGYWFWSAGDSTSLTRWRCRGCEVAGITRYFDTDPKETWDRVRAQWSLLGGVPTAERRAKVFMGTTLGTLNVTVTVWKRGRVSLMLLESDSAYWGGWFRRASVFDSRLPELRFAPGVSEET